MELTTELIFCGLLPRDRHYLGSSIVAGLDKEYTAAFVDPHCVGMWRRQKSKAENPK